MNWQFWMVAAIVLVTAAYWFLFGESRDGQSISVPRICKYGFHFPVAYGGWESDRCRRCGARLN